MHCRHRHCVYKCTTPLYVKATCNIGYCPPNVQGPKVVVTPSLHKPVVTNSTLYNTTWVFTRWQPENYQSIIQSKAHKMMTQY